ncbi:mobilization protein, partial [Bacteroides ovatus]
QLGIYLKKADYTHGDLKRQVSNILKSGFTAYRFQTFGEYSALLSCFNIEAKQVKGEHGGVPYTGIVYAVTDDNGKAVSAPIKSSLIDKRFGYQGLEKRLRYNAGEFKAKKWQPKIRNEVALAMHGCMGSKETFTDLLRERGIDTVFRTNDEGRIYGVTFIDHNNKEVYNGSRLGKEFSANVFEKLFRSPEDAVLPQAPLFGEDMQSLRYGDMESSIEQAFGMFSFDTNGPDAQEEALARMLQKKKKKKRRSRGLS